MAASDMLVDQLTSSSAASVEELVSVSGNIAAAVGNIIAAAAPATSAVTAPTKQAANQMTEAEKQLAKDVAKKTEALFSKVATNLFTKMNETATPVEISSPTVTMAVQKFTPKAETSAIKTRDVSLKLPPITSAGGQSVNMKVLTFKRNPYTFGNGSEHVNSPVTAIDMSLADGSSLSLDSDMEAELDTSNVGAAIQADDIDTSNVTAETVAYHVYDITSTHAALKIDIGKPSPTALYKYLGKMDAYPTDSDNDFYFEVRDNITVSRKTWNVNEFFRNNVFSIFIPARELTTTGKFYVLITKIEDTTSGGSTSSRRLLAVGSNDSYSLESVSMEARVWDDATSSWKTSSNLEVDPNSSKDKVVFKSNFFGSFCAGLFIPPNKIDFDRVFANFDTLLADNPIVLIILCSIVCLYLLLVIWARRADLYDRQSWDYYPLIDNRSSDTFCYRVSVFTGMRRHAGTTANVFVVLYGSRGKTKPRVVMDGCRKNFDRGSISNFLLKTDKDLGRLKHIQIWHDNSGKNPAWYLSKVIIFDVLKKKRYFFACANWIAEDRGECRTDRLLKGLQESDMKDFKSLFNDHTRKNAFDDHIWLSVFKRPTRSRFSRVQRLSCCLAVLFLFMITNAMWFKTDENNPSASNSGIDLGFIKITYQQVFVGFMGACIVVPPTVIVMEIFRRAKPRQRKGVIMEKILQEHLPSNKVDIISQKSQVEIEVAEDVEDDENVKKKKKRKIELPWWSIVFGYILLFIMTFTGGFFTLLYSLDWGREKSLEWLATMLFAFLESVFVVQPIKLLLLAFVFSCILRIPNMDGEESEDDLDSLVAPPEKIPQDVRFPDGLVIPNSEPDFEEEDEDVERRKLENERDKQLSAKVRETVIYILNLALLIWICSANRDSNFFLQNSALKGQISVSGKYTVSMESVYDYIKVVVLPAAFPSADYNGNALASYDQQFISDMDGLRMGPVRLRQARVRQDAGTLPRLMKGLFDSAEVSYNDNDEESRNFNPAWELPSLVSPYDNTTTAFTYHGAVMHEHSHSGHFQTYKPGGYVVEFHAGRSASTMVDVLKSQNWIDRYTRAVFVEYTINNANTNVFSQIKIIFEFPATGGIYATTAEISFRPYPYVDAMDFVLLLVQLVWAALLIYLTVVQVRQMVRQKCTYFHSLWNVADLAMVLLGYIGMVLYGVRIAYIIQAVEDVKNNPGAFVSFDDVALVDDGFAITMGVLLFIAWMQMFRPLSFNWHLAMLRSSLGSLKNTLSVYGLFFVIIVGAYCMAFYIVCGRSFESFRDFLYSFYSLFGVMLGLMVYEDVIEENTIFLQLAFLSYNLLSNFIMLNCFISVVCDTLDAVKNSKSIDGFDYEMNDHLVNRVMSIWKSIAGINKDKKDKDDKKIPATQDSDSGIDIATPQLKPGTSKITMQEIEMSCSSISSEASQKEEDPEVKIQRENNFKQFELRMKKVTLLSQLLEKRFELFLSNHRRDERESAKLAASARSQWKKVRNTLKYINEQKRLAQARKEMKERDVQQDKRRDSTEIRFCEEMAKIESESQLNSPEPLQAEESAPKEYKRQLGGPAKLWATKADAIRRQQDLQDSSNALGRRRTMGDVVDELMHRGAYSDPEDNQGSSAKAIDFYQGQQGQKTNRIRAFGLIRQALVLKKRGNLPK
ncbi:polycystic kidney disease protein 1-like 2 [Lingula anatina]|uniref:Polycystic kidney disease protein 1-like 2 n=1 Tax=Lingula anatina TaxID=7574 RepID=A0A1S3IH17_LINAN|nr:polycystic kidney disease protein 1-like 2 [Lingula anatina]|eukprot:XP_013397161.1 polycystic kidney disease protein 1-like 2 [Lingula anatina]